MGSNDENDASLGALLLCHNFAFPMIFKAAIELKLFEIIAREGNGGRRVSAAHIASQLPAKDPEAAASRLDRILCFFVGHSLLTCTMQTLEDGKVERLYGLTPVGRFFAGGEDSMASVIALDAHKASLDVWLNLKDVILSGGNLFKNVHGIPVFEYMDKDPTFNNIFNQAMAEFANSTMKNVMKIYKGFEGLNSLLDVGGGTGKSLNIIISKYPSLKGINFDLPYVIQTAPSYPGIEHVGGDMFSFIPNADALMIKDTLHNWDDEHCIKALRNCYEALPNDGKVIVINLLMPEVPNSSMVSEFVTRVDNVMLVNAGGKERTEKEFEDLGKKSGFKQFRVACMVHSLWGVMEFTK